MKKMTCELCGSTDFVKEGGVFVCQGCGCKYSVEEAKKLMIETTGAAEEKNTAQMENLIALANSAYESKNYAKAEEFCNQILALDGKNYEIWLLKSQAIDGQCSPAGSRIREACDCALTAYRLAPESVKAAQGREMYDALEETLAGEMLFWFDQYAAGRPTYETLTRAWDSYRLVREKMSEAMEVFGLTQEEKDDKLVAVDDLLVSKTAVISTKIWRSTVAYNYYRGVEGPQDFGRRDTFDRQWVLPNADMYRPTQPIWETFISEVDNLIALLQFAELRFNENTTAKIVGIICGNIAYFAECAKNSGSWELVSGYKSTWDDTTTFGWREHHDPDYDQVIRYNELIETYTDKENRKEEIEQELQGMKAQRQRQRAIDAYWAAHPQEKQALDTQLEQLQMERAAALAVVQAIDKKNADALKALQSEREEKQPAELEADKQSELIRQLEEQRSKCGIFKGKEKKALTERIETQEQPKLAQLQAQAAAEKQAHQAQVDEKIAALQAESAPYREQAAGLESRIKDIQKELNKDR